MSNEPSTAPKTPPKPANAGRDQSRTNQFSDRRRRDMATRSTLARLRNRKSALK